MSRGRALLRLVAAGLSASLLVSACAGQPSGRTDEGVADQLSRAIERQLGGGGPFDQVRAVVVLSDGETVLEEYYDASPDDYWNVASVTKSVMSALVGVAIDEGLVAGVEEPLSRLLPAYADDMTPAVAATTLRQVLTMTGGFEAEDGADGLEFQFKAHPIRYILQHPQSRPGAFSYSSAGSHLLSAVLEQATGMSVLDYARSRLLDPLGVDTEPAADVQTLEEYAAADFTWPVDEEGRQDGWAYLKLRPTDMARFGQLYLDEGRWKGEQLVPAAWVEESTTAQVPTPDDFAEGYGYLWRVLDVAGETAYVAFGFGGQLVEVVPSRGLVVAVATEYDMAGAAVDYGVLPENLLYLVETAVLPLFPAR